MKYTDDDLKQAILTSTSIRQVLTLLNLSNQGGNYTTIYRKVQRLNIDTSHFTGQCHNKGKTYTKTPTTLYLNNTQPIGSYRLKNRLIKENYLVPICLHCELTVWQGKPMPLELDHIDGNSLNNNLDNLRLLCPNCHSFTETYRGKNQQRAKKS